MQEVQLSLSRVYIPISGYVLAGALMTLQTGALPFAYKRGVVYDVAIADPVTNVFTYYYDAANGDAFRQPLTLGVVLKGSAFPVSLTMGEDTANCVAFDSANMTILSTATLSEAALLAAISTNRAFMRTFVAYAAVMYIQPPSLGVYPSPY